MRTSTKGKRAAGKRQRGKRGRGGAIDFGPVWKASRELAEWALDLAEHHARHDAGDVEAVSNTRRVVRAVLAGRNVPPVDERDVLCTLALLIDALGLDCAVPGVLEALEATLFGLATAAMAPPVIAMERLLRRPSCCAAHARLYVPPRAVRQAG